VFPNQFGRQKNPDWFVVQEFPRVLKKAELPPQVKFHGLRHTAATLLLSRGVNPKVVQEMLGHSNISITLVLYGHVLPNMQQDAANVMDTILEGENGDE
jgi:integrase